MDVSLVGLRLVVVSFVVDCTYLLLRKWYCGLLGRVVARYLLGGGGLVVLVQGCTDAWIHGCMDVWTDGHMDVGIYGRV